MGGDTRCVRRSGRAADSTLDMDISDRHILSHIQSGNKTNEHKCQGKKYVNKGFLPTFTFASLIDSE